jgi:hypothetical protein
MSLMEGDCMRIRSCFILFIAVVLGFPAMGRAQRVLERTFEVLPRPGGMRDDSRTTAAGQLPVAGNSTQRFIFGEIPMCPASGIRAHRVRTAVGQGTGIDTTKCLPPPIDMPVLEETGMWGRDVAQEMGRQAVSGVNFIPYHSAGFYDNVVVTLRGKNRALPPPPLYADDLLSLSWCCMNTGDAVAVGGFSVAVLIDGVEVKRWTTSTDIYPTQVFNDRDQPLEPLPVGDHLVTLIVDVTNAIAETDESDNEYSKVITILPTPTAPNLSSLHSSLTISNHPGTYSDTTPLNVYCIYVDWSVSNTSPIPTGAPFYTALYVDDVEYRRWITNGSLARFESAYVLDFYIDFLAPGMHTFKLVLDVTNAIAETIESDNENVRTVTCSDGVNLTSFCPPGWSNTIVVSNIPGTNTDTPTIVAGDPVYMDYAALNNGSLPGGKEFYDLVLFDDQVVTLTWANFLIPPGSWEYMNDLIVGFPGAGTHTIRIYLDINGDIAETDETDNEVVRPFSIETTVPIQLHTFTALRVNKKDVDLRWTTLSETGNYGFVVERAGDERGVYTVIQGSFRAGHGTSLIPHQYDYVDTTASAEQMWYRLAQTDLDGTVHRSEAVRAGVPTLVHAADVPVELTLMDNYPNPFNPSTTIRYGIPGAGHVLLSVFNLLGEVVAVLQDSDVPMGYHEVVFDAAGLPSGVYFARLEAAGMVRVGKLILSR